MLLDPCVEPIPTSKGPIMTVYIPGRIEHAGLYGICRTLNWICPVCGEPRGEVKQARSYDGSRILHCDGWSNPCGHIDKYDAVREEARQNGLNDGMQGLEGGES